MIQLIEAYNDLVGRFEDWAFKYIVPPMLKIIEIGLKFTMVWAFYMLVKNTINEIF